MERRSTRGRTSSVSDKEKSPQKWSPSTSYIIASLIPPVPDVPVPEVDGEEVVLNRRGMPARQRKRNRLYYDDEVMVTSVIPPAVKRGGSKSPGKKVVKSEPVEIESEEEQEMITGDLPEPEYGLGSEVEVEIPNEVMESIIALTKEHERGRGRTPKKAAAKTPSSSRMSEVETTPKGKTAEGPKNTPKSSQKSLAEKPTAPKPRGKSESSKTKTPKAARAESGAKGSKSVERPVRGEITSVRKAKGKDSESRSKSIDITPIKPTAKIKKEQGVEDISGPLDTNRYFEKREKDRLAKERERKREKERIQKDREYSSTIDAKSPRTKRDLSPQTDLSSLNPILPLGQEDLKQAIDKKTAQDISLRLRNLLKLPKAHKWVCYEWFYSNVDKVLFESENDFQICLKESFPQLRARKLTRVEWCKIRRLMGKPRRCSQAFFDEEREELARRRQKIRMIQQRKITDFNYKELPDEIPLQLTIGTKVTARLRRPQDGLFTGAIDGVDTSNNTYRITFDRVGLGTHSIPDYEVLANEPVETVSTSSFALKIPRRSFGFGTAAFKFQNPGLIGEDGIYRFPTSPFPVDGMLGGFPIRLLDMIVRLSKLLKAKREKILQLKELNVEAEKMRSYGKQFNSDYRKRYARCVLDLDSMNKEMAMYVEGIQTYCLEQIAPDHGANQMIVPEQIQEQCRQEANLIVDTYNTKQNRRAVHGTKPVNLIGQLTSLMLQVKTLSIGGERNLYELKSVKDTIKEIKGSLEGKNLQLFQDRVEIPMNRIQAGLCMPNKPY